MHPKSMANLAVKVRADLKSGMMPTAERLALLPATERVSATSLETVLLLLTVPAPNADLELAARQRAILLLRAQVENLQARGRAKSEANKKSLTKKGS